MNVLMIVNKKHFFAPMDFKLNGLLKNNNGVHNYIIIFSNIYDLDSSSTGGSLCLFC